MNETSLQVTEGQGVSYVHLTSPFPPGFFTANISLWSSASILVTSQLIFDGQLSCQGRGLPQAVLRFDNGDNNNVPCGLVFTSTNWNSTLRLAVRAVIDSPIKDGNQNGNLKLSAFFSSKTVNHTVALSSVQVRVQTIDTELILIDD